MKAHIITIQNSLNYGAYLQAFALMKTLKKMNYEVDFINTHARKPYKRTYKKVIKDILNFKLEKTKYDITLLQKYKKSWKKFKIIESSEIDAESVCITGSDEIWNVRRKQCADFPIFWGEGLNTNHLISYAPSCNITTQEELQRIKYTKDAIKKYKAVSVRDKHSKELIETITDKKVQIVLDPTMLLTKEDYKKYEEETYEEHNNYLFIYSYGEKLNNDEIKQIKEIAQKEKLIIIAAGLYIDWADKNIPASPFEFLNLIRNAKYVITDTFHGTIFSILYNKQFITYSGNNIKINNLLEDFNIQNRDIYKANKNIEKILKQDLNYETIEKTIEDKKQESLKFLKDNI